MAQYKQDMAPAGGYAPITYERVPIKKGLSAITKLGICLGITGAGLYSFLCTRDRVNNNRIEMRCAKIALQPMIEAEVDRMLLKQLKRNRDAEERIMKNVEGWEVGKWKHSPVYLSFGPDEFFKPLINEYYAHSEWYYMYKARDYLKSC